MGLSTAESTMQDARARGATDSQALLAGFFAGATEMVMEKLPLDNLMKIGSKKEAVGIILDILKQSGIEGMEEGLTTIANTMADALIMGDKSELNTLIQQYMSAGYNEAEAQKRAMIDWGNGLALDVSGGMLSSGFFGAAKTGFNAVTNQQKIEAAIADIMQNNPQRQQTTDPQVQMDKVMQDVMGKSKTARNFVRLVEKISSDLGVPIVFKSGQQIKADFIKRQTEVIANLESIANPTQEQMAELASLKDTLAKVQSGQIVVNGDITANGIVLNTDTDKPLNRVVGHEVTHKLSTAKHYAQLRDAVFAYARAKGVDIDSKLADRGKLYEGISDANPEAELVADLVGDYLFTDYEFVSNLSVEHQNVFQWLWNEIKYLCKIATAGSQEARDLARLEKVFADAYRKGGQAQSGVNYSIVALENGNTYVKASRNVIQGTTKAEQRREITDFFDRLLEDNDSLDIHTIDGDVLTITRGETANKARDDYKTVNGQQVKMSDNEFAVKLRAEAHIDEVAEVSSKRGWSSDTKGHPFAKDGFSYRRAYFEDFDGQYYEVTLSIGHNGTIATVYNVGKIKGSVPPSAKIIAVVGSKPLGETHSKGSKSQKSNFVKTDYSLSNSDGKQPSGGQQDDGYAPTYYSQMAKVLDGVKQEKLGAASVVNMLRGKGVKAEEIKWSGIEQFLEGKKSVTKAELQEFIKNNRLEIEEETLDNNEIPYTEEQSAKITEYTESKHKIMEQLATEWERVVGTEFPYSLDANINSDDIDTKLLQARNAAVNKMAIGEDFLNATNAVKAVIEANDNFGFDRMTQAYRSIVWNPENFIANFDVSSDDASVIRKFAEMKRTVDEVRAATTVSEQDSHKLKTLANRANALSRKISDIKSEHYAESAKRMSKWGQYKLDGGENYREYLFKMPGSDYSNQAMNGHWGGERTGVLAHARVQDFDTENGKMLFIEEIQSDWHNAGAKTGYGKELTAAEKAAGREQAKEKLMASEVGREVLKKVARHNSVPLDEYQTRGVEAGYKLFEADPHNTFSELLALYPYWMNEERTAVIGEYIESIDRLNNKPAPDAPFRSTYHEFVLKNLIRRAAEEGYDCIGWTTAEMQSDRWSEDYAEGYRIEYDQDIPKFLNKYGKKWGAQVGKTDIQTTQDKENDTATIVWSMPITEAMKQSVLHEGQPLYSMSQKGEQYTPIGGFDVFGKDIELSPIDAVMADVMKQAQQQKNQTTAQQDMVDAMMRDVMGAKAGDSGVGDMGAKTSDFRHEVKRSQTEANSITTTENIHHVPDAGREALEYTAVTEAESLHNAQQRIEQDMPGEQEYLRNAYAWTGEDVDTGMGILRRLRGEAKRTGDWSAYKEWRKVIKDHGVTAGQALQAWAKYNRLTGSKIVERASNALDEARAGTDENAVLQTVSHFADDFDSAVEKIDARPELENSRGYQLSNLNIARRLPMKRVLLARGTVQIMITRLRLCLNIM